MMLAMYIYTCVILIMLGLFHVFYQQHLREKKEEYENLKLSTDHLKAPDCMNLVKKLNISTAGLTADEQLFAGSALITNYYQNKNSSDTQIFEKNECILPERAFNDIASQDMKACNFGNGIILKKDNPTDNKEVSYHEPKGCILTEQDLRTRFVPIIKRLYEIKDQGMNGAISAINHNIGIERSKIDLLNANIERQIKNTKTYTDDALEAQRAYIKINKEIEQLEWAERNSRVMAADAATVSLQMQIFLENSADKLIGLKYALYNFYFADDQNIIANISNGYYIPYDRGITQSFTARVPQYQGAVTTMIYGLFVPDTTGTWEFELTSDDSAYLWVNTDSTNINNAIVRNPGLHGMVPAYGSIALDGTDMIPSHNGYIIRIIQGNNLGPGGLTLRAKRPNSNEWFLLENNTRFSVNMDLKKNIMLFSQYDQGMLCQVYRLYFEFAGGLDFFKKQKPFAAVQLYEAYNMQQSWLNMPEYGITKTASFADNSQMVYTDPNGNRQKTHPKGFYGYSFTDAERLSIMAYGLFSPPVSGDYTFYFASDDGGYLWYGNDALPERFNANNALINNSGVHATIPKKAVVNIRVDPQLDQRNQLIPIRFVQGDQGGGNTLVFAYSIPGSNEIIYDLRRHFKF